MKLSSKLFLYAAGVWFLFMLALFLTVKPAPAHGIYDGVHGFDGQMCCGDDDCFLTTYAEHKTHFFFRLKPADGAVELDIPEAMITWQPIAGDRPDAPANSAHLCYRRYQALDDNNMNFVKRRVGDWLVYCAFIPPGSI